MEREEEVGYGCVWLVPVIKRNCVVQRIKERSVSMMRPRSIRRLFSLRVKSVDDIPWGLTSRSRRDLLYHFVGIQPNEGVGREGMSGAIIGMHMHDKTSTTAQSKDRQQHSRTIKTGTSAFKRAGRVYSASLATGAQKSTP